MGNVRLTTRDVARLRLANQQIAAHSCQTPQQLVAALGAMQAQDYRHALWAVGLRLPQASEADVEQAVASAAVVRTWLLRGTLHLVSAADVRWLLALLAPRVIAERAGRRRQLGLDAPILAQSRDLLGKALSGGAVLARDEALRLLEGVGIETSGQRGIHILSHLSLEGLLCQAAPLGRQPTFTLLDTWAPNVPTKDRQDALAELAWRYFCSHGPATTQDLAWWSGLTIADCRSGIALAGNRLARATAGDVDYWLAADTPDVTSAASNPGAPSDTSAADDAVAPAVYALPGYDEYILGYTNRAVAMDAAAAQHVAPGGNGVFRPTIVADGRVVATWRLGGRAKAAAVAELLTPLDAATSDALATALRAYDRFAARAL